MAQVIEWDLRRGSESVAELTPFFPTFAPTFFGFFNFRPENFWILEISNRKKSGPKNFAAKRSGCTNVHTKIFWPEKISNRTAITRSAGKISGIHFLSVVRRPLERVFPDFTTIFRNFFRAKSLTQEKSSGVKLDSGVVSLKTPLLIIKSVGLGTRMCFHYPSFDLVRLPSARSSGAMSTAAPEGMLPRRIKKKNKKLPCPAVPREGP